MEFAFWASIVLLVYPYIFYPPAVYMLGWIMPRPLRLRFWEPKVTVLIPAYNEADCIAATLQNKLDQNYPKDRLQIIVISDGSSDGTDDIVRQFSDRRVQLLRREGREGKAAALNAAARMASGEIIVFSDANSLFAADAIRHMVEVLGDDEVGYVTGSLHLASGGPGVIEAGVGAYSRYEEGLRIAETRLGSIIGVNGGVGAMRRELYLDVPPHLITDFVLPLSVIAGGHRVVFDPRVTSTEAANTELAAEFRMRVRVALRALQGIAYMRRLLNPFRYPIASFCIMSHKVLRYLGFFFMATALASNLALAGSEPFYGYLLGFHLCGYVLALLGLRSNLPRWLRRMTAAPSYLLMVYAAFAIAAFKFARGESMSTWRPRAG